MFITFEGIEGCGKTTQIHLLNKHLCDSGHSTLLTREPGGTPIGERIRSILLDSKNDNMSPRTELLLYTAGRNQHIVEKIQPALDEGKIVLCDRYADATTAYQGAARKIDSSIIEEIHKVATGGLMPVFTFLLDCPAEVGLGRARARNETDSTAGTLDRFEQEKMDFHERVRQGYLNIAKREPERMIIIDATLNPDAMHEKIIALTNGKLDI
ncbi:MAG: dTMP kinase [Deltaproteobacteria bacterium]|nr:dTMP kinase [Deltaproteobacteria bacterium]